MGITPVTGMPGLRTAKTATHRAVFKQDLLLGDLAGGKVINGLLSRDPGNTGDTNVLRAGLLMGKITATGKYAPSILGVTQAAYTNGGLAATVTAAQAAEIVRRVGATGNLLFIGPPTANGTNAVSAAKAYSAIDTATGIITTADIGADKVAGTLVVAEDGSGTPVTLISDGYGVLVTDSGGTGIDVPFAEFPIAGVIHSPSLIPWPTDTSIRAWICASLSTASGGKFVFDHVYGI